MRGYFSIGIEAGDKPGNIGNLVRTAHGFGAAFVFLLKTRLDADIRHSDTARSETQLPVYEYPDIDALALPRHCALVGVEFSADAIDLPSFRHPAQAAYILGGERKGLSQATLARCRHLIKIPTKFSLNVATAGAIVMYDRLRLLGEYPERPVTSSAKAPARRSHSYGAPRQRRADGETS